MACQKCGRPTFGPVCAFCNGERPLLEGESTLDYEEALQVLNDAGLGESALHTIGMVSAVCLMTAAPDGRLRDGPYQDLEIFVISLAIHLKQYGTKKDL